MIWWSRGREKRLPTIGKNYTPLGGHKKKETRRKSCQRRENEEENQRRINDRTINDHHTVWVVDPGP